MKSSRTKLVGPGIAVGAVSLGLIVIGSCGIGGDDTYVPPPPLDSRPAAVAIPQEDGAGITVVPVIIPPSPSWQVAPAGPPRKPAGYRTMTTTPEDEPTAATPSHTTPGATDEPVDEPDEPTEVDEPTTTWRTLSRTTTPPEPPEQPAETEETDEPTAGTQSTESEPVPDPHAPAAGADTEPHSAPTESDPPPTAAE